MSHPDPTYYHPSSCDCCGCQDRDAENFGKNLAALVTMPVAVAGIVLAPIGRIIDKAEENEKVLKQKRDEIIVKNEEHISNMNNDITLLIDDLNNTCKSRPLAPENPLAFFMATFFSAISILILIFSSYYLLCIPVIALYCIFYYYDNTQARKEMYKKYNEDYKLFEKELEGFMSILDPKIKICVEAIAKLDAWYAANDYILLDRKDRVDVAQAWPEKIELNLAGPSHEFKRRYSDPKHFPKYKLKYSKVWMYSGWFPFPRVSKV